MGEAKEQLNICMLGHKRIPSREGGIEIVVEELSTRMVAAGHKVTCLNRSGKHVSGEVFTTEENNWTMKQKLNCPNLCGQYRNTPM